MRSRSKRSTSAGSPGGSSLAITAWGDSIASTGAAPWSCASGANHVSGAMLTSSPAVALVITKAATIRAVTATIAIMARRSVRP